MPSIKKPKDKWHTHFRATDVLSAAQIAAHTTSEIMTTTEHIHLGVLSTLGVTEDSRLAWLHKCTRLIYAGLKIAPNSTAALLKPIGKKLSKLNEDDRTTGRKQTLAAINGVIGDQLTASHNPLATKFKVFTPNKTDAKHQVIFLHGLCMDESAWQIAEHTELLEQQDIQLSYVRYNSGLPILENANKLEQILGGFHKPGTTLSIVGHSMGGIVAHQTLKIAAENQRSYLPSVKNLITVGSPHLGAPLAKLGHWVEQQLHLNNFTLPFTYLTSQRSAGIKDLQKGFAESLDLPNLSIYCIAGELNVASTLAKEQLGDGLVTEASALGLANAVNTSVISGASHLGLLRDERVWEKLEEWL